MLSVAKKRRKFRQNVSAYKTLITTPASGLLQLKANAIVYLKSIAGCSAGTTAATIVSGVGTRTIKTPLLAAGRSMKVGWVEKGMKITPVAGFDLLIDTGLSKLKKVGAG